MGDTIKVTLKNNARFTTSLHPHGVLYSKSSEGSPYDDGTGGESDEQSPRLSKEIAPPFVFSHTCQGWCLHGMRVSLALALKTSLPFLLLVLLASGSDPFTPV